MKITVSGKFLKQAFNDLDPILNKSEMTKSVAFTVENNKLYITANAGLIYQSFTEITSSVDYLDMAMTVLYDNVSDFIRSRSTVELTFTPVNLELDTEDFSKSFKLSDSIVSKVNREIGNPTTFDFTSLSTAIQQFNNTTVLQKTLKTERPYLFFGNYGLLKYPTVSIKVRSSGVNSSMSKEYAKCVKNFEPLSMSEDEDGILAFHKENSLLLLPLNKITDDLSFESMVNSLKSVAIFSVDEFPSIVQKILKASGNEQCTSYVYKSGLEVCVQKDSSRLARKINCSGEQLASFTIPLEYLNMSLNLLREGNMEILIGGDKVCMRNNQTSILMSANY